MKKIFALVSLLVAVIQLNAQQQFIKAVNYRGAFAPAPAPMWTDSWTNWDPQNTAYPPPTKIITTPITSNTTWYSDTVYEIQGLIYVKNNAILNIQAGTIIRGDANTANSSLVVTKGSKVYAIGTAASPIVFTSNKAAGSRAPGDWGGVILLGKASYNGAGGIANIEGIAPTADTEYGGGANPDDNDNSGVLKYVRIEFGGYVFQPNKEINGLTFGAVGRGTTIDNVQCSFINDDAFEWFGGTVNCSHLVSYRGVDDEFDTDNGFSGNVQFCLGVRDPQIGDPTYNVSGGSTSEGFESDNDATGSTNTPQTRALFSNITFIGPLRGDASTTNQATIYPAFRRNARLRRNTGLRVLNSVMMDYPRGVHIDGTAAENNASSGVLRFKNNIVAGNVAGRVCEINAGSTFNIWSWFGANNNDSLVSTTGILTNPYDFLNPDYRPAVASPALSNYNFTDSAFFGVLIVEKNPFLQKVDYRGAFSPCPSTPWTQGWTNWDPQNTAYTSNPAKTRIVTDSITSSVIWYKDTTYVLQGLIYIKPGATLTIQAGTLIKGDASVANSSLVVTKGGKLFAVGTAAEPIVFTSSKPAGSRAPGDWGGLIILGKAHYNGAGGIANIEGIAPVPSTEFGGGATPDDNDNSGVFKYIRVEFGGYVFQPNKEINGVTFGAVGRGTTVDYIQCSFINDDAFEWFGGAVNCAHLISYRGVDDEFDTDNGFNGAVQFCLGVRDPQIGDPTWNVSGGSVSEGFESDNDATGSANTPFTSAVFSNITFVGPLRGDASTTNQATIHPAFRRNARIRRNSRLKVFNSIMMDYPRGVHIDGTACETNATNNDLRFSYNLVAGNAAGRVCEVNAGSTFDIWNWFGSRRNDSLVSTAGVLANPYDFLNPDYRPCAGSPGLFNYNFNDTSFNGLITSCEIGVPGPITGDPNVCGVIGTANTLTYSVPSLAGASFYTWSVPANASIVSGQGTNSITVSFSNAFASGSITVTASAACGATSAAASVTLVKIAPAAPAAINGPTNPCIYIGTANLASYSVAPVSGAARYRWTVPVGGTIASANSDSSVINVSWTAGFVTGSISVKSVSLCGTGLSAAKTLILIKKIPSAPAFISAALDVCDSMSTGATYRINAAANAISYTWTLPADVSFASAPAATDTVIKVVFAPTFVSGNITVVANNGCGTATKFVTVKKVLPKKPLKITNLTNPGSVDVCTSMSSTVFAARRADALTTSFTWTLPAGVNLVGYPTDSTVEVSFDPGFTMGSIMVHANRNCGSSADLSLLVKKVLSAMPGTISGLADICDSLGLPSPSGSIRYTIKSVNLASSYSWVVPAGATIVGSSNDTSILVNFATFVTGDKIQVRSNRACGSSNYRILSLKTILPPKPVSMAGPVGTDYLVSTTTYNNVCSFVSSGATAFFTATKAANDTLSTSFVWTAPANATIVSGQGTATVGIIFNNLFKTGTLSVKTARQCGQSAAPLTRSLTTAPFKPLSITPATACAGGSTVYTVTAPVPSFATRFRWTVPTGSSITSANADSSTVTVSYPSTFNATGKSIKVKSVNDCGTSLDLAQTLTAGCFTGGNPITRVAPVNNSSIVSEELYPNPNQGSFTLNVRSSNLSAATAKIQIINMYGQVLAEYTAVNNKGLVQMRIDNKQLVSGIYTVRCLIGEDVRTVRMVVQK